MDCDSNEDNRSVKSTSGSSSSKSVSPERSRDKRECSAEDLRSFINRNKQARVTEITPDIEGGNLNSIIKESK